ncbi:macrolide family glycosyltransferase (plasmid) [Streptomyces sp. CA-294286]|uniref:macrolide family glycosyltransferase n=1 Tax=Streptomyces sp. CA-294286 TaxID=3240070 RepID=UPI003D901FD9
MVKASVRRAHLAVFNVPMHGHVMPTLAVVQELVDRGYRVSYAVTQEFGDHVRAVGAEPVFYEAEPCGEAPEDMAEGVAQAIKVSMSTLSQLESAFASDRPDAVLYDVYAWAGPLLAARWEVPVVQLSPTHLPYDGLVEEFFSRDDLFQIPGVPGLANALAEFGVPGGARALLAPPRTIAFFPRAFQRRPETVQAAEAHWVGPALATRSFQGRWEGPQDGRPVVYVSLGSQFNHRPEFYRTCVEAFTGMGWHVVMSVGAEMAKTGFGRLSDGFEVHASVPQLDLLAASSAFVTHGGMGSVMESFSLGVPVVVVPQMAEQRVNARRVEQLGLGLHLPREQTNVQALRESVRDVIGNSRITEAINRMRQDIDDGGGASAAADIVEKVLADTPRVTV